LEYANLKKQPFLDYRIWKKGATSQSVAMKAVANFSQTFNINSITGDVCGLLVYLTPVTRDVSPAVFDTFYGISSIDIRDQGNVSLLNNVVMVTSQEIIDYAVQNSGHDFWTYKNVYLIPFTTTFTDCIINNKINGLYKFLPPSFKIIVTPSSSQSCNLNIVAYVAGVLRISGGSVTEYSS